MGYTTVKDVECTISCSFSGGRGRVVLVKCAKHSLAYVTRHMQRLWLCILMLISSAAAERPDLTLIMILLRPPF